MKHTLTALTLIALLAAAPVFGAAFELSTAFTYSGRLDHAGQPAEGLHDFEFELWSARSGGELLGALTRTARPVEGGVFTEELDFGDRIHEAEQAWLEIRVRGADDATFTTLTPRQRVEGGGSTCTVTGDAVVEGRLAVGTSVVSSVSNGRVHGSESSPGGDEAAFAVTDGTGGFVGSLLMDGDEIDSWLLGAGTPMLLNANADANVSIGTHSSEAPLQIGRVTDASPAGGGTLVVGETDGLNIAVDSNEIMARDNGATASLFVNHEGGDVSFFAASDGTDELVVNGTIDLPIWRFSSTTCTDGVAVFSPSCPAGAEVISGGCAGSSGEELQASVRVGNQWFCRYTACDAGAEAHVLCLGIK